ncbi:MAG: tetratricopeptide repeat protein [Lachnoclostridium sp.]|nr:tetratricopeptide repeat protein [Lachnoclostridium sp.]
MKKFTVLTLGLAAAFAMSAQTPVKDVEKAFKGADTYAKFVTAVDATKAILDNPGTENVSSIYFYPGKAAFKIYDDLYGKKTFNEDVNLDDMGNSLLDGYTYYNKALAVDTIVDAKGKVKTPHSKDIASAICGHFNDFNNVGSIFWEEKKFDKAYQAWTDYLAIPQNPAYGKYAPAALPDSVVAQIDYWRAIAAWQVKMLPEAAAAFDSMLAIGYDDPQAYDYAFSVAYELKDSTRMFDYSRQGFEKFGAENPLFLQRMINSYIQNNDYATAQALLEKAIAEDPTKPAYYYSLGVLFENKDDIPSAIANYKKATELAPEDATNMFRYGNALARKFEKDQAKGDAMSQAEYNKFFVEELRPELLETASVLEKAYSLDEDNMRDALNVLRNVYYLLNDEANLKRVEDLLKY